jgi:hypothetical protein
MMMMVNKEQGTRTKRKAGTFWPKSNRNVGMLLVDLVIPPNIVNEFSHASGNHHINATQRERALYFLGESTPARDPWFSMARCKLSICDWTKVEFDENKDATGAKDAGEFVKEMWVVADPWVHVACVYDIVRSGGVWQATRFKVAKFERAIGRHHPRLQRSKVHARDLDVGEFVRHVDGPGFE